MSRTCFKIAAMISTLLCSGAMAGPAEDKIAKRVPEPFPGYARLCGFPILYTRIRTVSLARIDARLGKLIVLDPILTRPVQAGHQRFLIAHECAHHLLGHTAPDGLQERAVEKGVTDQELSADCWAAEALAGSEYAEDARFVADMFFRQGLYSPGSGYPSGVQRSTMIFHCLKTALRDQEKTRGAE